MPEPKSTVPPTASPASVRLVLADDHRMVLSALRHLLESRPGFEILATVHDTDSLLRLPELSAADLVVLDLNLPSPASDARSTELPGLRALPRLRELTRARLLILSMHDDSAIVLRALHLGAHGFVTKGSPGERLFEAIDAVLRGTTFVDPLVLGVSVAAAPRPEPPVAPPIGRAATPALSRQEQEVGHLLLAGLTQKAISHRLGITPQTTHTYKRRLKAKVGATNDAELLRKLAAALHDSLPPASP